MYLGSAMAEVCVCISMVTITSMWGAGKAGVVAGGGKDGIAVGAGKAGVVADLFNSSGCAGADWTDIITLFGGIGGLVNTGKS